MTESPAGTVASGLANAIRGFRADPVRLLLFGIGLMTAGWAKYLLAGDALYVADWVLRLAVLGVMFTAADRAHLFAWPERPFQTLLLAALVFALLLVADAVFELTRTTNRWLHALRYPDYAESWVRIVDLSVGILLVALTEELIYRSQFVRLWKAKSWGRGSLYAVSTGAFAFLHVPQGLALAAFAGFAGYVLMALYRKTGSLAACVIVHYATDLAAFSGMDCPVLLVCHQP